MQIAILADIHSNFEALCVCVEAAQRRGVRDFLFLGDYLGDLAEPQKTMRFLYDLRRRCACEFIRGNKENYWIDRRKAPDTRWEKGRSATGMLWYNYAQLTDADIDFFESLPIARTVRCGSLPAFTVCHGSPFKVGESMRPDYPYIDELTARLATELTVCGHFHRQTSYTRNGRRVINPGSVGVPLGSSGKAQFLILRECDGCWTPEFFSVPYDVEKAIDGMKAARLDEIAPGWYKITAHLLRTGEDSHAAAIRRVSDLYFEATGIRTWQDIPEEYWEKVTAQW